MRAGGAEAVVKEVLRILEADWRDPLRCTNVEQALHRAGQPFTDEVRRSIAEAVRTDPRRSDLLRWHPAAYFLTNEERWVARSVLRQLRPAGAESEANLARGASTDLGIPEERASSALRALRWAGFLEADGPQLRLSPQSSEFLEGVGFYFHEVVAGEERFNVNCFHDFVLLTSPSFRARRLRGLQRRPDAPGMTPKMLRFLSGIAPQDLVRRTYEEGRCVLRDACAGCDRAVQITVEHARLVAVQPGGLWHVRAGGCGVNNVFCSRGCAEDWAQLHGFVDSERGPVEALWS